MFIIPLLSGFGDWVSNENPLVNRFKTDSDSEISTFTGIIVWNC